MVLFGSPFSTVTIAMLLWCSFVPFYDSKMRSHFSAIDCVSESHNEPHYIYYSLFGTFVRSFSLRLNFYHTHKLYQFVIACGIYVTLKDFILQGKCFFDMDILPRSVFLV